MGLISSSLPVVAASLYLSSPLTATEKPIGWGLTVEGDRTPSLQPIDRADEPGQVIPLPEVVRRGDGPVPMLLIPCMSSRWNEWEEFMDRNRADYTMFAVSLPGFGGTPMPDLRLNSEGTPWRDNAIAALSQFLDDEQLRDVVVVGHSWGTMVAIQLAADRPDAVGRVIAVDGSIESTTWTRGSRKERLAQAAEVISVWSEKFDDAEQWRRFNGASLPAADMVPREDAMRAIRMHGSFMATPKAAMLQYWRENLLIDLTADLHKLDIPILDIDALFGEEQEQLREQHAADLATARVPEQVRTVYLYDTRHFVMFHRPDVLDRLVADFIAGVEIADFKPVD